MMKFYVSQKLVVLHVESVLTIDDDPSRHLESKLEILDRMDIGCVFFWEGRKIQKLKESVESAVKNLGVQTAIVVLL